jgi:hypothetical protein
MCGRVCGCGCVGVGVWVCVGVGVFGVCMGVWVWVSMCVFIKICLIFNNSLLIKFLAWMSIKYRPYLLASGFQTHQTREY